MNSFKVAHDPLRDARQTLYDLYSSRIVQIEREYLQSAYRRRSTNVSCQCNIRRDVMCTCRRLGSPEPRYFSSPKQVYRYTDWRSFTDIGVGSIKALPRKRIRKIYLPETIDKGIGSANLTPYMNRKSRQQSAGSYYENKRTSSKCVGGIVEDVTLPLVSKQLSPIIRKQSGTTSPVRNIVTNDIQKRKSALSTQVNTNELTPKPQTKTKPDVIKIKSIQASKQTLQSDNKKEAVPIAPDKPTSVINDNTDPCKDYSSDSLVQHVHNLENPSEDKQSKMSVDPMENKLEREYRKIFTSKSKEKSSVDKTMGDFKSASLLKRRFEALRRGLGKKESKKEAAVINKVTTSQASMLSHKDVSIASDPPSLEGRSFSNTKVFSPYQSTVTEYVPQEKVTSKKSSRGKKNKENPPWGPELGDSKYESVQGMFKLWGKKFNLDDNKTSPTISNDMPGSPDVISKTESPHEVEYTKKKQGRKFFLFGKKTKDINKENKPYKPKKGVTTGRCEVKDGLTIKMGGGNYSVKEPIKKPENRLEKYDNILRNAWLDRYITNTRDSRNSVHIRWNNKMYATSSSTVLELMDSVYKQTGINFRSRSEITTGESANYQSYTKQRVHFMQQDIEAWMVPKMITNKNQKPTIDYKTYQSNNKCRRWFVDASKGFSQKIELVLRSKSNSKSSEYLIINIPEGYFSQSSSELRVQSSDEKIYKIVEYETSELKKNKETRHMATGDNIMNDLKIDEDKNDTDKGVKIPDTDIEKSALLRDVAIQGSDVFVPKRCDVIGVGIITQRDIRDGRQPILKLQDGLSDEDSEETPSVCKKKCELAESFLQDYCRHWMPSGIDMFPWHMSDSQHSENNSAASLSQGDGSKSYPNMYENFQESTILLSSCETSSCSHCIALEDEKKPDDSLKSKFLNKFKKKPSEAPMISDKRNCPKDSLEVHKRRQFYAFTNQRCKWFLDESYSLPSLKCKAKNLENQKHQKPCWKIPDDSKKLKQGCKHVSLPGCEQMSRLIQKLSDKSLEGILNFKRPTCKKDCNSPKHVATSPTTECTIPQPPCKEYCETSKKAPPCTKKKSPPCNEPPEPLECGPPEPIGCGPPEPVGCGPPSFPECEPPSPQECSPSPSQECSPSPSHECPPSPPPRPCDKRPKCPTPPLPLCIKPVKKPPCSACKPVPKMSNESLCKKISSRISGIKLNQKPSPKPSDSCLPPPKKQDIRRECKPDCANKKKLNKLISTPATPPPTACKSNSNELTGLHLKKMPCKKKSNINDCTNNNAPEMIRLNSQENFSIRMKKETPSTEEIRECVNIKVQDEDGQTLFERIDYKQSRDANKCLLLQDVYTDPQIHRVSTPIAITNDVPKNNNENQIQESKSESSVDNLIEINFTLKLKQGDKGTEVNIKNDADAEIKQNIESKATESQKSVYVVQNRTEPEPVTAANKKDVNIKIIIKNYNTDHNETDTCVVHNYTDDLFNKRISEKFQTVSTGYSDTEQNDFSNLRIPVNLTTSTDRSEIQSKPDECLACKEIINIPKKQITSSQSVIECSVHYTDNSIKYNNEEISITSLKKSSLNNEYHTKAISFEETDKFDENKPENFTITESKDPIADTDLTSDDSVLHKKIKLHNTAEKKAMLKRLLKSSSAIKKPENKRRIKDIIRAIMTSDSSAAEITVTSNEITKELTQDFIDPGYYRDTDSMNNYYRLDSEISNYNIADHKLNPTKDTSEVSDNDNDVSSIENVKQGCMCSTLATKLNLSLISGFNNCGCCCKGNERTHEKNEDNIKTCVHVETQSSKHVLNKLNSANMSLRSETQSVVIANTSVIIKNNDNSGSIRGYSNTRSQNLNDVKYFGMKGFKRQAFTGLSEDDMLVLNSSVVKKSFTKIKNKSKKISKHSNTSKHAADILQLNETKKAVLEIYKERIQSDEGEKLVAKLPKFDVETENEITNYEDIVKTRRTVRKRNFVMMTINR